MRLWSFRIGRIFGVDVRLHIFFLLLLGLLLSYAGLTGANGARGTALWGLLLFAVAVREVARALVAVWLQLELRSILLLPIGGILTYATTESTERSAEPRIERALALAGPIANLLAALVLAALILAVSPAVDLVHRPWMAPIHLLRAMVWMQLTLAAVHLLPAFPLDGGRILRSALDRSRGSLKGARAAAALGQAISFAMVLLGFLTNIWPVIFGTSILLAASTEGHGLLLRTDADAVRMRDVMLTDFTTLSASDTLQDALHRSIHSLQDVFPVVRGARLVGVVGRQTILATLEADGNGYLQGIMTRNFATAQPDDSLVSTLRRIMAGRVAQLVPVVEDGRVVGIITPQNLSQSMGLLDQSRRLQPKDDRSGK